MNIPVRDERPARGLNEPFRERWQGTDVRSERQLAAAIRARVSRRRYGVLDSRRWGPEVESLELQRDGGLMRAVDTWKGASHFTPGSAVNKKSKREGKSWPEAYVRQTAYAKPELADSAPSRLPPTRQPKSKQTNGTQPAGYLHAAIPPSLTLRHPTCPSR